ITGLEPTMRAAGPVFTVRGRPDPTMDKHTSLYEWAGLLSRAPAGHVDCLHACLPTSPPRIDVDRL
ncbi:MAG TPA: hypothetical protein VIM34_07140, partial [Burkholderiaceae bacterium]